MKFVLRGYKIEDDVYSLKCKKEVTLSLRVAYHGKVDVRIERLLMYMYPFRTASQAQHCGSSSSPPHPR